MQQSKGKTEEVGSKVSDFKIIKELGKGSYGTVYTVKSLLNSNIYVMKKMELNHLNPRQQVECYREVSILKKVSHKNIIKYYSSFIENNILYIIMEYAELGDLYSLIKHYKKHSKFFSELDLWKISSEILSGLDYLHSHNIIHRDIKCLNLFITKDRHIKIGDLGVSAFSSGLDLHYTRVGTPLYISPELVKQKPYDYKTDIWSFGCSLYHLACLEPPFTGGNLIVLGNNIVKGVPKALPNHYSNDLKNFVDKMLEKKAEKRPSAKEALDMIPNNILNDMKIQGEKIVIKSKRPFSSAVNINPNSKITGNKVITVNKEEIKNIFSDNEFGNNSKDNINNKNATKKSQDKNKNENNIKEIKHKKKSEEKNKVLTRNNFDNENNNYYFLNNFNLKSYNDLKEKKENSSENKINHKKIFDLSFNIPSFNNQKGFNNFRKKQKLIFENNFPGLILSKKNNNKFNHLDFHNVKIMSPLFKNNNISKQSLKQFLQHNLIEQNSNRQEKKEKKEQTNINVINNEIKNINIININQISPISYPINSRGPKKEDKNKKNNNNLIIRLNTDDNQFSTQNDIKFPELKKKSNNNNINLDLVNNNINIHNNSNIKYKSKRLTSAKPLPLRPLTSKINKILPIKNKIDILNNNYTNIISNKQNIISDTDRNYSENKYKKNTFRPMTGFHPQINNNVMNININFYNIDMNKRFLIPEINPYKQDKDNKNIKNETEDNLLETIKFKNNNKNNITDIDLDKYKNSNEFLFQKIIKSIQEIQGNDKRLTIKDLV